MLVLVLVCYGVFTKPGSEDSVKFSSTNEVLVLVLQFCASYYLLKQVPVLHTSTELLI